MIDPKTIDEMVRKLSSMVPAPIGQAQEELEKNFKAVLQSLLQKMDLVTREEYDVQVALLNRTRERLTALETRISLLETPPASTAQEVK